MAPVADTIRIFEDKAERIVWLPVLTLGYSFVLTGFPIDFWLSVFSIVGATLFGDLIEKAPKKQSELSANEIGEHWAEYFQENYSGSGLLILFLAVALYPVSVIYGLWRLNKLFTHTDPILVALSGMYWGVLLILLLNSELGSGRAR